LKQVSEEATDNLQIDGICHVTNFHSNVINDKYAQKKYRETGILLEDATNAYSEKFNINSSVGFYMYKETQDYLFATTHACAVAKELIKNGAYKEAEKLLKPHVFCSSETPTIEVLYNYSICLKKLGLPEEAFQCKLKIIQRYLNLPTIRDLELFKTGCFTYEDILESIKNVKKIIEEKEKQDPDFRLRNSNMSEEAIRLLIEMEHLEAQEILEKSKKKSIFNQIKSLFKKGIKKE